MSLEIWHINQALLKSNGLQILKISRGSILPHVKQIQILSSPSPVLFVILIVLSEFQVCSLEKRKGPRTDMSPSRYRFVPSDHVGPSTSPELVL